MKQPSALLFAVSLTCLLLFSSCSSEGVQPTATESQQPHTSEETLSTTAPEPTEAITEKPTEKRSVKSKPFDPLNVPRHSVSSTCFSTVGYDPDHETLVVQFRNSGSIYAYSEFDQSAYDRFISSDSLGGHYNDYIKGRYPSERLS